MSQNKKRKKHPKSKSSSKRRKKSREEAKQTVEHLSDEDNQFDDTTEDGSMNSPESETGNNALINTFSEKSHELISEEHDNEHSTALMTEDSDEENENNELMSEEETEDLPVNEEPKTEEDLLMALDALEREWIGIDYTDFDTCLQKLGLDRESCKKLHPNSVKVVWERKILDIDRLFNQFVQNGILTAHMAVDGRELTIRGRFGRLSAIFSNTFQIC